MKAAEMYMEAFRKDSEEILDRVRELIEDEWKHITLEDLVDEIHDVELDPFKTMGELIEGMDDKYTDDIYDIYWTTAWKVGKALMDRMPEMLMHYNDDFDDTMYLDEWDRKEAEIRADKLTDTISDQVDRIIEMMWGDEADIDEEYLENPLFEPFREWFGEEWIYEAIEARFERLEQSH